MSDTTNRIAGLASITINGQTRMMSGDFEYNASSVTRETMTGLDRVHGYAEKPSAPHIAGQLRDAGDMSVADFNAMTNVSISLQLANGKNIIGRNMWTVENQTVKIADATFEVRFEGFDGSVVELTK